jgi:hypothetical protein
MRDIRRRAERRMVPLLLLAGVLMLVPAATAGAIPSTRFSIPNNSGLAPGGSIGVTATNGGVGSAAVAAIASMSFEIDGQAVPASHVSYDHATCPSGRGIGTCAETATVNLSGYAPGDHTLAVTATDSTGAQSPIQTLSFQLAAKHTETWVLDDDEDSIYCHGGSNVTRSTFRAWVTYAETNCGTADGTPALQNCHQRGHTYCTVLQYIDPSLPWTSGGMLFEPLLSAGLDGAPAPEQWYVHSSSACDSASRVVFTSGSWGVTNLLYQGDGKLAGGGENPCWSTRPYEPFPLWLDGFATSNFERWDGLMVDDMGLTSSRSYEELPTDADSVDEHNYLASWLLKTTGQHFLQVDNSWSDNPYIAPPTALYSAADDVHGMIMEGAPWSTAQEPDPSASPPVAGTPYTITPDGTGHAAPWAYQNVLDSMGWVDSNTPSGDFLVLLSYDPGNFTNPMAPGNQLQGRLVQEATVLLGYAPGKIVDWADLENPDQWSDNQADPNVADLAIWPEEGLYPTEPVSGETMSDPSGPGCMTGHGPECTSGGHNTLQVVKVGDGAYPDGGYVYRREFVQCFNQGNPIGPCAAIVNDSGTQETVHGGWLKQSYRYVITPEPGTTNNDGWDVRSGGWINTCGQRNAPVSGQSFTPDSTKIAPWSAILIDHGPPSGTCGP